MMLEEYAPPVQPGYPNKYIAMSTTTAGGFLNQVSQDQVAGVNNGLL